MTHQCDLCESPPFANARLLGAHKFRAHGIRSARPKSEEFKPVKRETFCSVRARGMRPIIVELRATFMIVRPKGSRLRYSITYDQLYTIGALNAAEALRKERAKKRAELKAARKKKK